MGKDYIMRKKSFAFTLAEVLVTMTIIGVIAALTIPTLNYQRIKNEYSTRIKNFYSKVDNAVLDMEQDYGSFRDLKKPATGQGYTWYMKYLDPYIGHSFVRDGNKVYYSDGSLLTTFYTGGCLDVDYDVNGDKKPNRQGYDRFRFLFCFTDDSRTSWFGNKHIFFGIYGSGQTAASTTRESMIAKCKTDPAWCTRLLQNDNWEFRSDYPFKF